MYEPQTKAVKDETEIIDFYCFFPSYLKYKGKYRLIRQQKFGTKNCNDLYMSFKYSIVWNRTKSFLSFVVFASTYIAAACFRHYDVIQRFSPEFIMKYVFLRCQGWYKCIKLLTWKNKWKKFKLVSMATLQVSYHGNMTVKWSFNNF